MFLPETGAVQFCLSTLVPPPESVQRTDLSPPAAERRTPSAVRYINRTQEIQNDRGKIQTQTIPKLQALQQHTPETCEPLTGAFLPGAAEPAGVLMEDPNDWRTAGFNLTSRNYSVICCYIMCTVRARFTNSLCRCKHSFGIKKTTTTVNIK